jgi:CRP-like cAMP-binding protein
VPKERNPQVNAEHDKQIVGKAPLFSALDEETAHSLQNSMTSKKVSKGHTLFKVGAPGNELFVVVEGKMKLGTQTADGRENLLTILGPGEMFGELSIFDPGPRTSTATAVTDCRLLSLSHTQVLGWITAHPEVSFQLLARLAQRLRRSNEVLADLVFSDVPGRVAKAILDLGTRFGVEKPDGLHVHHDLTQEELAQLVGASRETVNKALADFAGRGWIRLEPRTVVVLDYDRLYKRGR